MMFHEFHCYCKMKSLRQEKKKQITLELTGPMQADRKSVLIRVRAARKSGPGAGKTITWFFLLTLLKAEACQVMARYAYRLLGSWHGSNGIQLAGPLICEHACVLKSQASTGFCLCWVMQAGLVSLKTRYLHQSIRTPEGGTKSGHKDTYSCHFLAWVNWLKSSYFFGQKVATF